MNITVEPTIRMVTAVPGPRSFELQKRRESSVPRGVGSVLPVYVRRAAGATIKDVDGNVFLDFAGGIGCQNAGHAAPEVTAAVAEQAAQFLHTCFMVNPYEGYVRVAEMLNARAPGAHAKKTLLVNSGAEAVENAVKIARHYTKREGIIAFSDAFHGRTQLALTLTSKEHPYKTGFGPFAPGVYRAPYAYCYRCPVGLSYPGCGAACAQELEGVFAREVAAKSVAAVIFEPVLGEGGFVAPPIEWFCRITEICRKHGILMIADEIQSGAHRTGSFYASERFGVDPDLILTGKSLAGGLPLAAVTGRAEIMDSPVPGGLGGTFGGNPVACAAAVATLENMDRLDLRERAEHMGRFFESFTRSWPDRFPIIGDIRGVGAMRAIEMVRDRATKEPASEETRKVLSECHSRGLLILSAGTLGNVIRILVPLVATDAQLEEGFSILEEALGNLG